MIQLYFCLKYGRQIGTSLFEPNCWNYGCIVNSWGFEILVGIFKELEWIASIDEVGLDNFYFIFTVCSHASCSMCITYGIFLHLTVICRNQWTESFWLADLWKWSPLYMNAVPRKCFGSISTVNSMLSWLLFRAVWFLKQVETQSSTYLW